MRRRTASAPIARAPCGSCRAAAAFSWLAFSLLLIATACAPHAPPHDSSRNSSVREHSLPHAAPHRVLFVGNSLTYVNDLPAMVRSLAASVGVELTVGMLARPNFGLEEHWQSGYAQIAIRTGHWDVVVLQQGPSALPESRVKLVTYAKRYGEIIKAAGAVTALYSVWETADSKQDFDASAESYRAAARATHGIFLPAGNAWQAAWRRDSTLQMYAPDGLHPTALGSYLAALVIAGGLTGRSPVGMDSVCTLDSGDRVVVPRTTAALLQASAAEALAREADTAAARQ